MPKNYNLFLKGDVGGWNFSSDMVNWILEKNKDSEVHVLINSLGGYTHEALSISSLFKLHGNVHVHFIGANASAATIAAMGAKRITIDSDACFLVHKCLGLVFEWDWLNADELDAHIRELEKKKTNQNVLDGCVAGMYSKRCKKTKVELLALMSKDSWLTPEQALDWGFVDEITDRTEDKTPALSDSTVASLAASGIPIPPMARSGNKGSFKDRLIAFINSFSHQAPETTESQEATLSPVSMDKLTSLATLLGVALSVSDGKISLTEDQLSKINDTLEQNRQSIDSLNASVADKDKTISELQATIAQKDTTICELRKEPAASTSSVHDTDKDEPDPYAPVSHEDGIAASKAFLEAFA